MKSHQIDQPDLAAALTRAASQQTYSTIRWLVDRPLVAEAYRAYAYFRWLDDWLDRQPRPRAERLAFVQRQQALLESCARGRPPAGLTSEEAMLAGLVRRDPEKNSGLQAYLRNMLAVMAFDADRRGRLISQSELNRYTHWLAVAVTEAMHYFIGHTDASPSGETRYVAVTGAHITHMLRDAVDDAGAGYYNIPGEVVAAGGIDPGAVETPAYRAWVQARVRQARACFRVGRDYLARVENVRCRIAGYAYIRSFETALDGIEREGYWLRAQASERENHGQGVALIGWALWMALGRRSLDYISPALPVR